MPIEQPGPPPEDIIQPRPPEELHPGSPPVYNGADDLSLSEASLQRLYEQSYLSARRAVENSYLKQVNEDLSYEAVHDSLTSLPNRRGLQVFIDDLMERRRETGQQKVTIFFADATNFKIINDQLGHDRGDEAIIGMADVLKSSLRSGDFMARVGGDEFVIIPAQQTDSEAAPATNGRSGNLDAEKLLERIRNLTDEYLDNNPKLKALGHNIAVGWTDYDGSGDFDIDELIRQSEQQMSADKAEQHQQHGRYRS